MDPISITTGVVSLLGACLQTGLALKDFYDGAAIADTKVKGLLTEVESFTQVLRMMRDTLEQENIKSSLQATGHIGNHWNNLATSIRDGQNTLLQLQGTIEKVNKSVSVLDGARKHMRLKSAADEIATYQQQIRSYRDTLQLSLQTVILWNQVTFRESTDKILPNLDDIHQAIRRIAFDINDRIAGLQNAIESNSSNHELHSLTNLRNCVRSAASVVSSASTTLGVDRSDRMSVTYESDFGDCFPSMPGETMLRWISSNTVYEFEEERDTASSLSGRRPTPGKSLELVEGSRDSDQSDSDGELEAEIIQSLLRRGKDKLASQEFEAAERHFRNCLSRTSSNGSTVSLHRLSGSKSEIMTLLIVTYRHQEKWDEAHALLTDKISFESRGSSKTNQGVLADTLILVEVLLKKCAYAEALLYGRRALKSYRKLGSEGSLGVQNSLRLLCQVCKASGNYDEEDAYGAILLDILQRPTHAPKPTLAMASDYLGGRLTTSAMAKVEKELSGESPSVESLDTPETLRSDSSWLSSHHSTVTSVSTTSQRRPSSLNSFESAGPTSPYTTDLPSVTRPRKEMPVIKPKKSADLASPVSKPLKEILVFETSASADPTSRCASDDPSSTELEKVTTATKDTQITQPEEISQSQLPLTEPVMFEGVVNELKEAFPQMQQPPQNTSEQDKGRSDSLINVPRIITNNAPLTSDYEPKDEGHKTPQPVVTANASPLLNSNLPLRQPPLQLKIPESKLSLSYFKEEDGARALATPEPVTPAILLQPSDLASKDYQPKGPVTLQRVPSRSGPPNIILMQHPGYYFSHRMANHTQSNIEVAAIEYFRAKKGNPPKPVVPTLREVIPVSDYELSEWIGTHPDMVTRSTISLTQPNKVLQKSTSALDLFDLGVVELPAEFSGSRNLGGLNNNSDANTSEKGNPEPMKSTPIIKIDNEWDTLFGGLNKAFSAEHPNSTTPPVQNSTNSMISQRVRTEGVLIDIFDDEVDHPDVKTFIEMGYPRVDALAALEKYDYNLERAANYLVSRMSDELRGSQNSQTDIRVKRMGVVHDCVRLNGTSVEEVTPRNIIRLKPSPSFEPLRRPVSFQSLVQLQSSALDSSSNLSSYRSESNLIGQANTHHKSRSFDSGFPNHHSLDVSSSPGTAEGQQNELSDASRRLQSNRPQNPIASHWDANFSFPAELPRNKYLVANDLTASLSIPPYQNQELGTSSQQNLFIDTPRRTSQEGTPAKPTVAFSEIESNRPLIRRKVVMTGDPFCGKSALLSMFSKGVFPLMYHSAELEVETIQEQAIGRRGVELVIWDAGGDFNYASFRLQCYADSHLVMICFAIDSPESLENAEASFTTELKKVNNSVRYILVGLKMDLRYDPNTIERLRESLQHPVTIEEGHAASIRMGALRYIECSAKTTQGVKEAFEAVTSFAVLPNDRIKKSRSFRRLFGKE